MRPDEDREPACDPDGRADSAPERAANHDPVADCLTRAAASLLSPADALTARGPATVVVGMTPSNPERPVPKCIIRRTAILEEGFADLGRDAWAIDFAPQGETTPCLPAPERLLRLPQPSRHPFADRRFVAVPMVLPENRLVSRSAWAFAGELTSRNVLELHLQPDIGTIHCVHG